MRKFIVLGLTAVLFSGCAEPGETTGVASATGGALGAGLGALIGSQTGNAGAGLVIGAVGGAATGAAVGNAIEAQQVAVRTQDEAIERQEKLITNQRREIDALRNASHDNVVFKNKPLSEGGMARPSPGAFASPESGPISRGAITERSITPLTEAHRAQGASRGSSLPAQNSLAWTTAMDDSFIPTSTECSRGREEMKKADAAADRADRLFHVRRALRLCPEAAPFHNKLGELYVALDRRSDAEFSFKEALKIRGDYTPAQTNLAKIRRAS